tara:strand:- start:23 stop:865 length:843 start_codon:yes stop_codon:yes gene_type:complete
MPGPIGKSTTGNESQMQEDGLLRWRSIDVNDASWTEADPGSTSLVQSITSTTSGMRIVTDNADFALRWNTSTQTSPRYYKKLQGPGSMGDMAWAQAFSIEFLCTRTSINANDGNAGSGNNQWDSSGIVVGIADESCVADVSDVEWVGAGFFNKQSNGALIMRYGGDSGDGDLSNSAAVSGYHVVAVNIDAADADGDTQILRGAGYVMNSSAQVLTSSGMSQQTHEYDGTEPVYLFVSPTFAATTSDIDADTDTTWKLWYRIRVAKDDLVPDYIPGEGYSG